MIHPYYPHLGATPDGLIKCNCCGSGVLEVKCPYSCVDKTLLEATSESGFCLDNHGGEFSLKRNHTYYYQIQAQMMICSVTYGDFIVWCEDELFVERISLDEQFVLDAFKAASNFFTYGILPELLGKWYSKLPQYAVSTESHAQCPSPRSTWCFCQSEESGMMIACDNERCKIIWFHLNCLRLKKAPKGKWLCPECSKTKQKRSRT